MVSPGVIAGFAAIDASLIAQAAYAARDLRRRHEPEPDRHSARQGPVRRGSHRR